MKDNRYIQYARWIQFLYTTKLPVPYILAKIMVDLYPYPGNYLTTIGGITYELDLHDLLQANIAVDGVWAPIQAAWWQFMAGHSKTVLDVGGHIGYFTLLAKQAAPACKVHAFEPNPRMAAQFERHIELNQCEGVTLNQMAISDHVCSVTLHVRETFEPGTTSIKERPYTDRQITVDAVTLDAYLDGAAVESVELTKIDIEGAEEAALRGMKDGLISGRYGALFLGIHQNLLTDDELANIALMLNQAGYTVYEVDGVQIHAVSEDVPLHGEFLALRASDREQLGLVEENGTLRLPDAYVPQVGG